MLYEPWQLCMLTFNLNLVKSHVGSANAGEMSDCKYRRYQTDVAFETLRGNPLRSVIPGKACTLSYIIIPNYMSCKLIDLWSCMTVLYHGQN